MDEVVDSYELSPMQASMLYQALSAPGDGTNIEHVVISVDEELDVALFEQAMAQVMQRHSVMRTRFRWVDVGEPCQEVLAHAPLAATVADWRDIAPEAADERFDAHVLADSRLDVDMSDAPMMRLFIARLPAVKSRVLWTFHHALLDGRSYIVLHEWFALYEAAQRGELLSLPAARPYRDYIEWRRSLDHGVAETFWRERLGDFGMSTPFGIDAPHAADESTAPASACEQRLPKDLTEQLRHAAHRADVSVSTMVQAAWAVLLHRYSGESDIVFGVTRAGRITGFDDADRITGLFINTLPMRVGVDGDAEIGPWLRALRAQQSALRPYEQTPLGTVQACSGVARGAPLFESVIVYDHHTLDMQLQMPGRHFEYRGQTNFPLALMAYGDDGSGAMLLRLDYSTKRFAAPAVTRMLGHLVHLLAQFADGEPKFLGQLDPLSVGERVVLVGDGGVPVVVPRDVTLHAGFARQVAARPDAVAVCADGVGGRVELSYAELDCRAEAVAGCLRGLGVGAGAVVGLRVARGVDVVVGILGILKVGAAYLPLDPLYPVERVGFMLADAGVGVVLTQRGVVGELGGLSVRCVCLDEPLPVVGCGSVSPAVQGRGGDLAYVMYTSGSTGQPKGVRVTHRNVLRLFETTIERFGFGPDDVWTLWHSYSFDISVSELWGALLVGGRLVVVDHDTSRDPAAFRGLVERERVSVLSQTPTGFCAFIDVDRVAPRAGFALRYVLLCGEALQLASLAPWFERYGDDSPQVINMYGPTEATLYVTCRRITGADLAAGVGSVIGAPLPDIRIYLLDEQGRPVPIGVPGELYIAGAGVAAGYLNRPELTAQRFLTDPFHGGPMYRSGDLARRGAGGELEYLGRIDQQVKIRGFRVELGEVETVIAEHPAVHQVAVIDREDVPGEKKLVAYLVAVDAGPSLIADLRQVLHTRLPEYMVPAHFQYLDALPLTTSAKLDRKALPAPTHQRSSNGEPPSGPRNPAEETIADVWKAVLRVDSVGLDDHFFELGGDSLLSIRVHAQLTDKLRADLPIVALLQYPTVRTLARHLAGEQHRTVSTGEAMDRARRQREAHARSRALVGRR
ncbi:non-ribosomal peptide synthetase [Mycolicibacterium neoaurum]|uniref:Carrier domain-containing protein n=7 Tax=Mycobacteriaceae TaxID=1762 RepID=V5XJG2_MYCNE|nr:non-ribosomal peptide synthetase [Mycolicibacterium neoaurum]